jgi:hypothetical protein
VACTGKVLEFERKIAAPLAVGIHDVVCRHISAVTEFMVRGLQRPLLLGFTGLLGTLLRSEPCIMSQRCRSSAVRRGIHRLIMHYVTIRW